MIKQLLNSAIAKYRDLSVARRSITCLCLRHRQIIDLLATDKSRYFAQSRPIIVYYYSLQYSRILIGREPTLNFPYFCGGVSTWQINIVFVMCSRHQRQIRDLLVMCSRHQSYLSSSFERLQQVSATA